MSAGGPSAPTTPLGWMELQTRALFVHDARGRLRARNEPGAAPPPRLFLGRTRVGALWRLAADLPPPLVRDLARLAAAERRVGDPSRDPERLAVMRERLETHAPVEAIWRGPAFRFPEALPDAPDTRVLDPSERAHAARRFAWPEAASGSAEVRELAGRTPVVGAFAGGELASVCFAATGPAPAVEAGLATLPGFRGRGLGPRAVAAWASAVRREGRIPLYSTSADNRASRRVAGKLGLILYGWDLHLR
ncbi:MAG: GNAT family N-acetyltransferase [Myxococcota bacterium]|nr:GNAT family N-acetyltransferase [Myxococcota bacterium]